MNPLPQALTSVDPANFPSVVGLLFGGLLLILYILLPLLLIFLIIFAARGNWHALHKKEKIVEFVGFWRRISIGIVNSFLSLLIIPIFFNLYFYLHDGQTIGDKMYGTRLVDKKSMKTAPVGKLIIRKLARILSVLPFGFGFLAAGWQAEKRSWHDGLADVRYISYKKVPGFWTLLPFLLIFMLPTLIAFIINNH